MVFFPLRTRNRALFNAALRTLGSALPEHEARFEPGVSMPRIVGREIDVHPTRHRSHDDVSCVVHGAWNSRAEVQPCLTMCVSE
jgi:hypothetical protein